MTNNKTKKSKKWLKLSLISTASVATLATIPASICATNVKTSTPVIDSKLTATYYHVTFKLKDADKSKATLSGQLVVKVRSGRTFDMIDTPTVTITKPGYQFKGWVDSENNPMTPSTEIDDDLELYASFGEPTIVVTGKNMVAYSEHNVEYTATAPEGVTLQWHATTDIDNPLTPPEGTASITTVDGKGKLEVSPTPLKNTIYVFALPEGVTPAPGLPKATDPNVLEVHLINNPASLYDNKIFAKNTDEANPEYYECDPAQFYPSYTGNIIGKKIGGEQAFNLPKANFNYPIIFSSNITTIEDGFMEGFTSFDKTISFPQSLVFIGDNFMRGCTAFKQNLNISYTKIKSIGDNFLFGCTAFNNLVDLFVRNTTIRTIGNHFMDGCTSFSQQFTIPSTVKEIGEYFMYNCLASTRVQVYCAATAFAPSDASFAIDNTSKNATHNVTIVIEDESQCIYRELKQQLPDKNDTLVRHLDLNWGEGHVACIEDEDGKLYFISDLISSNICAESGNIDPEGLNIPREEFNCKIYLNPNNASFTEIPDNFLRACTTFNQELVIPSNVTTIGKNFLYSNTSFNQPLTIPSAVTSLGTYFMYNAENMTSVLTIEFDPSALAEDRFTCGMSDNTAMAYTSGIPIGGTYADAFMLKFANRITSPSYRNLYKAPL